MKVEKLGVIGAGQMGNGIAQVASGCGLQVLLYDVNPEGLKKGVDSISSSCDRLIKKEALSAAQKEQLLGRIRTSADLKDFSSVDMVIEAAPEIEALKFELFKKLDEITPRSSILASNTSSISITKIAGHTTRPEKIVGMHFMNPVPLMKLVEGIKGLATSEETFATTRGLAEQMGKTFVESNDFPGFIVNRVLMPMINEAVYALHESVAKPEDIDNAMKLGTNQPMGPLALADFIGLDTCLAIMNVLHTGLGDGKYRPCPLLVKYVDAGWVGKKSGRGFYKYEGK